LEWSRSFQIGAANGQVLGASPTQLHRKELSFNNTFDADLAWQAVRDFTSTCVAIVKHANLCGLSLGDSVAEAFRRALATDPQTALWKRHGSQSRGRQRGGARDRGRVHGGPGRARLHPRGAQRPALAAAG
jgi:hypothetical protein